MSPNWATIAAGAIGLAVLDGVLSRGSATGNVGGWVAGAGKATRWFLSPAVPAFAPSAPASSPTTTTTTATATAAPAGPAVSPPSSSAAGAPAQKGATFPGESLQTVAQGGVI